MTDPCGSRTPSPVDDYTAPSEDLSRPGQMWWAVPPGVDSFSTLAGDLCW